MEGYLFSIILGLFATVASSQQSEDSSLDNPCHLINNRTCPDPEVRFFLFTRSNIDEQQLIYIDDTSEASNLTSSYFDPQKPTKIIIHGFRSDMYLTPLFQMKAEYLRRGSFNIFFVDWSNLSSSLCYPAVVHNIQHVGLCIGQLVNRIRDVGSMNVHVIGFSLGAQVTNYVATSLKPNYLLPRITGLDPALPLFTTSDKAHKLDPSDAEFVDVFHCNSFMQGQIKRCGHADFYYNGMGPFQPGCGNDMFGCPHHRCAEYFLESIFSPLGFYGWKCESYFQYVLGQCPYEDRDMTLAGEYCDRSTRGMFLVATNSISPFAKGRAVAARVTMETSSYTLDKKERLAAFDIQGKLLRNFQRGARVQLINKFGKVTDN